MLDCKQCCGFNLNYNFINLVLSIIKKCCIKSLQCKKDCSSLKSYLLGNRCCYPSYYYADQQLYVEILMIRLAPYLTSGLNSDFLVATLRCLPICLVHSCELLDS